MASGRPFRYGRSTPTGFLLIPGETRNFTSSLFRAGDFASSAALRNMMFFILGEMPLAFPMRMLLPFFFSVPGVNVSSPVSFFLSWRICVVALSSIRRRIRSEERTCAINLAAISQYVMCFYRGEMIRSTAIWEVGTRCSQTLHMLVLTERLMWDVEQPVYDS